MQLVGTQMTNTSAIFGNDVSTFPDYPSEIRAPAGTLAGVSGYQLHFGARKLRTPGDTVHALVVMNPAALKVNVPDLETSGIIIANQDAFTAPNLEKAGYESNPLEDGSLDAYRVFRVPMERLCEAACAETSLTKRAIGRCKNFLALGLIYWLYDRSLDTTLAWIEKKFAVRPIIAEANIAALKAGYNYGENTQAWATRYHVAPAETKPGKYRKVTGNQATALGMVAAATRAGKPLFYGSYPITPASDILHDLSRFKRHRVLTYQAEDEIAAMVSVIGASYAGVFAATGTSGPGVALKSESIGLAIMAELPMVIVNVQRGGPSTGLPTKTEQADLFQAMVGRHGEAPLCVLAPATPGECFDIAVEAFHIAVEYMTPVMVLTDGYLANGAEPWRIPDVDDLPVFDVKHPKANGEYLPYKRDEKLARGWVLPGTPGLEHRIGGLEKRDVSGEVCYEPENHQVMCALRREKIDGIAKRIPPAKVKGNQSGKLLVVGWGSSYGAIASAVDALQARGAGRIALPHSPP